jgi:hypothetical protein
VFKKVTSDSSLLTLLTMTKFNTFTLASDGDENCTNAITNEFYREDIEKAFEIKFKINERDLTGLIHLPDIDDTSMAHVFVYLEYYKDDLKWSFASNSLFLLGSSTCLILRILDYVGYPPILTSKIFPIITPIIYFINSAVDICWSSQVIKRQKVRNIIKRLWNKEIGVEPPITTSNYPLNESLPTANTFEVENSTILVPLTEPKEICRSTIRVFSKIRKHAAHRRTVLAALSFGAAALVEVISILILMKDGATTQTTWLHFSSIQLYLLSAVISVTGKRTRPWLGQKPCGENHETLEDLGDLLFLSGSVVDYSFLFLVINEHYEKEWAIASAALWFFDACLYFCSDVSEAVKYGRQHSMAISDKSFNLI